jgi:hypothetical protein
MRNEAWVRERSEEKELGAGWSFSSLLSRVALGSSSRPCNDEIRQA